MKIRSILYPFCNLTQQTLALEPSSPLINKPYPGPKALQLIKQQSQFNQQGRTVVFHMDTKKSIGNFIADADGNLILDFFCHIAALPIGYNHMAFQNAIRDGTFNQALSMRMALGKFPPIQFPSLLKRIIDKVAPIGLNQILPTCGCGTSSNQNAAKMCFFLHRKNLLGKDQFSWEELQTALRNDTPGCPQFTIGSFNKGFHGRMLGALSMTHTNPIHKAGIPAFKFPMFEFPTYRYPLQFYQQYNQQQDKKAIGQIQAEFKIDRQYQNKIAGIIVQPIISEGGNLETSPWFFKQLRKLCTKYKVYFIDDQIQTGVGATGKFWAIHNYLDQNDPQQQPDMITFAKKAQCSGVLHKSIMRSPFPYQIFGTWCGDYLRLMQFQLIINTIFQQKLLQNSKTTGLYLKQGLIQIQRRNNRKIFNARGLGFIQAFEMQNKQKFLKKARENGLNLGVAGGKSVRLRPTLVMQKKHVDIALDIIQKTLKEI